MGALKRSLGKKQETDQEVISVSDTVSVAASFYETLRNSLEYDEEHLLRRNAIRRIIKRRLAEGEGKALATDLLRELIWARYLPNKQVPEIVIDDVAGIFAKYKRLFSDLETETKEGQRQYEWLIDILSSEIEYTIAPPVIDEALASFAYQEIKDRIQWSSKLIDKKDRDLQLYVAVHRSVLKSNRATLRFRILTLYYPEWAKAAPTDAIVEEIAGQLNTVIESVESQINHPGADVMYRLVRKHAIVFHLLRDIAVDHPEAFMEAVQKGDKSAIEQAVKKAAALRYRRFRERLRTGVLRAVIFLFLTKFGFAILFELPYERFVLKETNNVPLITNIFFHPILLGVIGFTVRIPEKRNTEKILEEVFALLGMGDNFVVTVKARRQANGALAMIFNLLYALFFLITIGLIAGFLASIHFNWISIVFFVFFLSLVTFFGLKLRNSKRELVIVETSGGFLGSVADIMFLPLIRAGRWVALRAPRINIFLFFFDFIVEAPFKAAIKLMEGWLAFLREKKEEI